jgi:hypothetical protein
MRETGKPRDDLLGRIAATKTPLELSEQIYRHCAALADVSKIDLICNESDSRLCIACFIETPSLHEARQLARHLGVTVFGEQGLVFDLPRPDGFLCKPFTHPGDAALPARVVFTCLVRS